MSSPFGEPPKKKFKVDNTDDVLAKLESKQKQIDDILAGFDVTPITPTPTNKPKKSLNFIPSSVNKSSSNNSNKQSQPNTNNKPYNEITKTITITATSYNIHHHTADDDPQNAATPPISSCHQPQNLSPEPIQLRPLPSLDAKPTKSVLRKSTFTTFRDEKRNKRRSNKSSKDIDSNNNDESDNNKTKRKGITFATSVKKEDGVSAKFYSSPQYLIRDGPVLRPKPREQIDNEKRLLTMLGAPEELAGRALPPGLLDEDWEEQYDPQIPNDYTSFVNARQRLDEWIQMRKVKTIYRFFSN